MGIVVFLVLGSVLLRGLERFFPAGPRTKLLARERLTDVAHVVLGQLVTQRVVKLAAFVTMALFVLALGLPHDASDLYGVWHRDARFVRLPLRVQAPLAFVAADFIGYWVHRAQHHGALWRFHSIHHSSPILDWLAAARNHPIADAFSTAAVLGTLLLLGFDPRVLALTAPLGLYAVLLHANVPWGRSWVRYVVATPLFHRWHHAHPSELPHQLSSGVNFAGLLPVWDLLFGTFHAPLTQPAAFGADVDVPQRFLAQLAFPFRGRPKASNVGA